MEKTALSCPAIKVPSLRPHCSLVLLTERMLGLLSIQHSHSSDVRPFHGVLLTESRTLSLLRAPFLLSRATINHIPLNSATGNLVHLFWGSICN